MPEDTRPDETIVHVLHKDNVGKPDVTPGAVSLAYLRQFGGGNWVEIDPVTREKLTVTQAVKLAAQQEG